MKYEIYVKPDANLKKWQYIDIAMYKLGERGYVKIDTIGINAILKDNKKEKIILTKDLKSNYWIIKDFKYGGTKAKQIAKNKVNILTLFFGGRGSVQIMNELGGILK